MLDSLLLSTRYEKRIVYTWFVFLTFLSCTSATWAESPVTYIAEFSCDSGQFGLRLPERLSEVMKLAPISQIDIGEADKWDGVRVVAKTVYFKGLTLKLLTFSSDVNRYMVTSAEIASPTWNKLSKFKIGETVGGTRQKLGVNAKADSNLQAVYGSEGGDLRFASKNGKVSKITYGCYHG